MSPLFALSVMVCLLFCGLVADIGRIELIKTQMQSAADAAAIAATMEAERGTGNWYTQAQQDAAVNGFTDGQNGATVSLSQRATSGDYQGRYDTLQATITQSVHTLFMGSLHSASWTITVQAAAVMTPCLYLVGTGTLQNYALDIYSGSVIGNTCPMYVNKFNVEPWGQTAMEAIDVAGASGSSISSGYVFPTPNYGVATVYGVTTVSDPLSAIPSPTFSGTCDHTGYSSLSGTKTLSPGTYCKGITLTNSTVTLNPGLYVITGGATWSNSTVTGNGVTLFFTTGGGGGYGQFKITNSSNVTLSAPSDSSGGGTPAFAVFADRSWTVTGPQDFQVVDSTLQGDGIWYLKKAGLFLSNSGTISGTNYFGLVADNLYNAGTILRVLNNYSRVSGGNPFRTSSSLVQ